MPSISDEQPKHTKHDLTGEWVSIYSYQPGTSEKAVKSQHVVLVEQRGSKLTARSVPQEDGSTSTINLALRYDPENAVLTGTWEEMTSLLGHYSGRRFHGTLQLLLDLSGNTATGVWTGFNSDNTAIKTGTWSLKKRT